MSKSNKIELHTDEYSVPKNCHTVTKKVFNDLGYEVSDARSDTHAIGGPSWIASDFVLFIGSHIFDAVLAALFAKGLDKIIEVYRQTKNNASTAHFYISSELSDEINIYFDLDTYNYENGEVITDEKEIEKALKKIPSALKLVESVLSIDLYKLLGEPKSIIMNYDFPTKEWIIFDHDSDASIFFADTPFAAAPKPKF
ncbi:MAG: hypothetical protein RDU25_04950 [Patescibacteria group bacterium]|nr:hypothetical protein [Patescibacteria group bacterium]